MISVVGTSGTAVQTMHVAVPAGSRKLHMRMLGDHQADNVAVVLAAVDTLRKHDRLVIPVGREVAALERVHLPGRLDFREHVHSGQGAGVSVLINYGPALIDGLC